MQSAISKLEAERAEVDTVLSSGVFGRTNNHVRLLAFVCEKYFEGAVDEIKEYSIAVHALGRPESFDPQLDTIVRVTAHALRKRLEDYYTSAGADHSVHICLPPGHYVPKFIHTSELEATTESRLDKKQNGQQEYQQVSLATELEESKPDRVAYKTFVLVGSNARSVTTRLGPALPASISVHVEPPFIVSRSTPPIVPTA